MSAACSAALAGDIRFTNWAEGASIMFPILYAAMKNAERTLYAAGNPHVYEPVSPESAFTELDRDNSRLAGQLAMLRGELAEAREDLKAANLRTLIAWTAFGVVVAGTLLQWIWQGM